MVAKDEVFRTGNQDKIWQKFCGFLDLSLKEFMQIQEDMLRDQITLVAESPVGKKIMKGQKPKGVEEFRRLVPLTRYEDYEELLGERKEDALAVKPQVWAHTSGRGGRFKWVPYTERALEIHADLTLGAFILACAKQRGEVNISSHTRFLSILAPSPYLSGITNTLLVERFGLTLMPDPKIADRLAFPKRIETGFNLALRNGTDIIYGIGTVLFKVGEKFTERSQGIKLSVSMLHPIVFSRLLRAFLISKMKNRHLLPSDIWSTKGLVCAGTDTTIYKDKIEYFWGRVPHEVYGATESGFGAVQTWLRKGLVFQPYLAFLEFIPEEEWLKSRENKDYQPRTVLLNEVEAGKMYELVITNFHGMPFLRYRPGDLLKVVTLEEKESGIKLPQFSFHSRADGLIDLYSVVRLDERTVWEAINQTCVSYEDWSARKEYEQNWPILRIYIEPKEVVDTKALNNSINQSLRTISHLYDEAVTETEQNPVRVTILNRGSFQRYNEEQQRLGVDLAQLKPKHISASDTVIEHLLECSKMSEPKS